MTEFILDYVLLIAVIAVSMRMFHPADPSATGARPQTLPGTAPPREAAGNDNRSPPSANEPDRLDETLRRIGRTGGFDTVSAFLEGVKLGYEIIVKAFAYGDISEHSHLMTGDVREAFAAEIAARRARGEATAMTFIRVRAADVIDAGIEGGHSWIDVRFVGEMVSVTKDTEGKVVAGHPERIVEIPERWTFERDLRSIDPIWVLAGTEPDE